MQRPITLISSVAPVLAALAALAVPGCGGSSGKFDKYVGSWHYDQALAPLNCGTAGTGNAAPIVDKVFQEGISSALVDVSVSSVDGITACDFAYTVSGMTANMVANQTCTLAAGAIVTPTQWRFTLVGPNKAEEVGSAQVSDVPASTGTVNCDVSFQATLTRVATD